MVVKRYEVNINGIVQGVGFRPYVYRLALSCGLSGWVLNSSTGIRMEVQGATEKIKEFIERIPQEVPPLAKLEKFSTREIEVNKGEESVFMIKKSDTAPDFLFVAPDMGTCEDCRQELFNSKDYRYRYPFISCTNCGPRFTIIKKVPYDRGQTTMWEFPLCPVCKEQYFEPSDRRFHAETVACASCGPQVKLFDRQKKEIKSGDPVALAVEYLKNGAVVAIKGIGGYHLACDALNEEAVKMLRKRKQRYEKPLAIMVPGLKQVREFCCVSEEEIKVLKSWRKPIVLLKKNSGAAEIAAGVAPDRQYLGVMLPYNPLHFLLFGDKEEPFFRALVMTSGNLSDEPIAHEDEDAFRRLSGIADYFLVHNRVIYTRCDDSVVKVDRGREIPIRRSRGYVPVPVKLDFQVEQILACGGEQKNTFCFARDRYAFLSHHIGDLDNLETLISFEEGVEHFKKVFNFQPKVLAYDLHPEYLSTKYALEQPKLQKIGVQHHHAHVVSCLTDNGVDEQVIGVAFDGTGFGTDGNLWGGEFLVCNYAKFQRKGYLDYVPLVSGEMAIKEPWRIGAVYLYKYFGQDFKDLGIPFTNKMVPFEKWDFLEKALKKNFNVYHTSSVGRFFDAAAAILGIRTRVSYEGQGAVELEQSIAGHNKEEGYLFKIKEVAGVFVIDPGETIRELVQDIQKGMETGLVAAKFHNTIARMILEVCRLIREENGLNSVVLSGGVFQNIYLLNKTVNLLNKSGFKVYTHHQVPTNDGGLSLGQVVVAHAQMR